MNTPLVSTISPCYKMKRYLKPFLEWLPKQTFFDKLEVVLDHNEPDREEIEWVQEFQKKYPGKIKHIIVNPVEPIGTSMNRCIKEASGKFVTIWNVDDLRTDSSIELQANILLNDKSASIVYGNYTVVNAFTKTDGKFIEHADIPESEFTRSMIFGPFIMFRKSLCETAGYFDESLLQGPDFDLSIRLAFNGKGKMVHQNLGYYLNEGKGLSTKPGSIQPIERTVIELRYGIYDKIDYNFLPEATQYIISKVKWDNQWRHVSSFVPHYKDLMATRKRNLHIEGIKSFIQQTKTNPLMRPLKAIKKHFQSSI